MKTRKIRLKKGHSNHGNGKTENGKKNLEYVRFVFELFSHEKHESLKAKYVKQLFKNRKRYTFFNIGHR